MTQAPFVISNIRAVSSDATIDFGSTPSSEAFTPITGQSMIAAGAHVRAWIKGDSTPDNSGAFHMAAAMFTTITPGSIVPGVGFNIAARSADALLTGKFNLHWQWNNPQEA